LAQQEPFRIAVVIVTYNAEEDIERNLRELRAQEGVALDVLVIDNGSSDRTLERISADGDVRVIANGENRWLAPAWNQGFAATRGEYVLFLTPDTSLPDPSTLSALVAALAERPKAGLAGPQLVDEDGSDLLNGTYRFPSVRFQVAAALGVTGLRRRRPAARATRPGTREVDIVNGACMLARRTALEDVGGFDNRYQLYWEEIDLARRLRDRGWAVLLVPAVTAVHRGKGSPAPSGLRRRAYRHGERVYMRTHHVAAAAALVRAARVVGSTREAAGGRLRRD
jgi:N-acetylglucosaminyl-diphospho-decaprenol L-rhamnosyltransferase